MNTTLIPYQGMGEDLKRISEDEELLKSGGKKVSLTSLDSILVHDNRK